MFFFSLKGVSISSLASLNLSDMPRSNSPPTTAAASPSSTSSPSSSSSSSSVNENYRLSSLSNSTSTSASSSSSSSSSSPNSDSRDLFFQTLDRILTLCSHFTRQLSFTQATLITNKEKLIELASLLQTFIGRQLKALKDDHACFHPDLSVFNRFKSIYRQLKEFYFFYESTLGSIDKIYAWSYDLIVSSSSSSSSNEYFDLVNRMSHLDELTRQLRTLVNEKCLFEYNSENTGTTISPDQQAGLSESSQASGVDESSSSSSSSESAYQYEYDNNSPVETGASGSLPDDMADYCTIDDDEDEKVNSQVIWEFYDF